MTRPFLTARWLNLGLVTFDVAPDDLAAYLPPQCDLDLRDGRAFVSLVMFDFADTRVRGVRWAGNVNFPEINLRFYVNHGGRRGVCFIREFVPKRLIAWTARLIYNEPYAAIPMTSQFTIDGGEARSTHRFRAGGRWHAATVRGRADTFCPADDSVECFFKEHQWGFGRSRDGRLRVYEVRHPAWHVYPAATAELHIDFAAAYGQQWAKLNTHRPCSVVFAVGSRVAVYPHVDS
jgi:uncharacterized protein